MIQLGFGTLGLWIIIHFVAIMYTNAFGHVGMCTSGDFTYASEFCGTPFETFALRAAEETDAGLFDLITGTATGFFADLLRLMTFEYPLFYIEGSRVMSYLATGIRIVAGMTMMGIIANAMIKMLRG